VLNSEQSPRGLSLEIANPIRGQEAELRVFNPGASSVSLDVINAQGIRLRRLSDGLGSGAHRIFFDGRDTDGHHIPSGIYFVRLASADGEAKVKKLVWVR
jgi:hypothetical protein